MYYDRKKPLTKKNVMEFLKSLGIEVNNNNKARGNQGIYLKDRIDISKNIKDDKAIDTLVHEFAHHIQYKIDKDFLKNGGSLETLFNTSDIKNIKTELIKVTEYINNDSGLNTFITAKKDISKTIKSMQNAIKREYPDFLRSKTFTEFEKYIKNSDAKYLVKYDVIKIYHGFFFKKVKILNIKNLEKDFPDMPKAFQIYIKQCSLKRKQAKISRRINKLNKYYNKTPELFARFVQGYFRNPETVSEIAPETTKLFVKLLNDGHYKELKDFFDIFWNGTPA